MKLYREDQRYHDFIALSMIAALALLLVATAITQHAGLWKATFGVLAIGTLFYVILKLKLKIRISRKKMSVRISPLPWLGVQIPRNEVTGVEFISSTDTEFANGWAVVYGANLRLFNFGDRRGMLVHKNDGSSVVILSRKLFDSQDQVREDLLAHGWNIN